ncbi:cephalosporin hydroxylase family protein [Afipia sp. TerB]
MFNRKEFDESKRKSVASMVKDADLQSAALDLVKKSNVHDYGYQWTWLGQPMIQLPPDIIATQEIIWEHKPDVIIETGIAWGGSIVFYASLLQLIGKGEVVAVDLNLYDHISKEIMSYPFSNRISLYKGSSTDAEVFGKIKSHIKPGQSVMVLLDSNHTHAHVLDELRLYAPLVTKGQFLVVSDTIIEDLPAPPHRQREWGPGNNPKSALDLYLKETDRFEEDEIVNGKLLTTFTPHGYMRCIK